MLGITDIERVETGRRYRLDARLSEAEVRTITESLLYNPVIQQYTLYPTSERPGALFVVDKRNEFPRVGPD